MEKEEAFITTLQGWKLESFLWTSVWRFLKNLTAKLPHDPDMSLLGGDYSQPVTEMFAQPCYCCTRLVWLCMDGCTCAHVYMCACLCCGQRTTLDVIPQMSSTFCSRVSHCPGSWLSSRELCGGGKGTSKTGRGVLGAGWWWGKEE